MLETHPKTLARRAALRALVRNEREDFAAPDFAGVEAGVRPFAREIYSNVLRHRARIDWSLAPLLKKPIDKLDEAVRAALRLALYEKVALRTPDRALANEYASLMRGEKLGSATGFVNAIARRLPAVWREAVGSDAERLCIEKSHPQWIVERYVARFGVAETEEILRANNAVAPGNLRVNTLKTSRDELVSQIEGVRPRKMVAGRADFGARRHGDAAVLGARRGFRAGRGGAAGVAVGRAQTRRFRHRLRERAGRKKPLIWRKSWAIKAAFSHSIARRRACKWCATTRRDWA